jgi:hypothetical protein
MDRGAVSRSLQEPKRLKNVTPQTLTWNADAFKAPQDALESTSALALVIGRPLAGAHARPAIPARVDGLPARQVRAVCRPGT